VVNNNPEKLTTVVKEVKSEVYDRFSFTKKFAKETKAPRFDFFFRYTAFAKLESIAVKN
jgi:hypothetical protein